MQTNAIIRLNIVIFLILYIFGMWDRYDEDPAIKAWYQKKSWQWHSFFQRHLKTKIAWYGWLGSIIISGLFDYIPLIKSRSDSILLFLTFYTSWNLDWYGLDPAFKKWQQKTYHRWHEHEFFKKHRKIKIVWYGLVGVIIITGLMDFLLWFST